MAGRHTLGHFTAAIVAALALGAVATFLRLLAGSSTLVQSALVVGLCTVAVATGVAVGSRGRPTETPYW